jgi:hypothetical protein
MRTGQSLNRLCIEKLQAQRPCHAGSGAAATQAGLFPPGFLDKIALQWPADLIGLILFGSAARGDATEDSDIDLLLAMRPEAKIARDLYRRWEEFCREYAGAQDFGGISPHFASLPESVREAGGLWYEAALDGIVLWERERQVSRFFGSVREAMAHGRIRRRMLHGSPYWVKEFEDSDA